MPGTLYPGQIVRAVEACRGFVLVLTPDANESPAANQSRSASVCVKLPANVARSRVRSGLTGSLAPYTRRRRTASSEVMPPGAESRSRSRSAGAAIASLPMAGSAGPREALAAIRLAPVAHVLGVHQ